MDTNAIAALRERLQRMRRDIVQSRRAAERGVQEVRDSRTDPEYEEGAQADHMEYTLGALSAVQEREIAQIDSALARMDVGAYGECLDCEAEIVLERLFAVPNALRCAECAVRAEAQQHPFREPVTL